MKRLEELARAFGSVERANIVWEEVHRLTGMTKEEFHASLPPDADWADFDIWAEQLCAEIDDFLARNAEVSNGET